jgi:ubiquinone/menaquinone biosynthesis C-methylase UbiE/uncharacterized protein YbaR (Trm112 family)
MKPTLINDLRSPLTGAPVVLADEERKGAEIVNGELRTSDGQRYAIVNGVPSMLPGTYSPGQKETRESFSEKWKMAPNYRAATKGHYVQWYLDRYGFKTMEKLEKFLSTKSRILDAGTGHGRDSELYATHSKATVYGLDISEGIHNAYNDLHQLANLHLVQGDLTRLPFPKDFFDFIACDQVLHHTPNTEAAFKALVRHLKPGGHIAIYVYKVKGPIRQHADEWIRERTTRMSPEDCMKFSEAMTKLGKALSELKATVEVPDIPLLEIKGGTYDVQRFIYWHMMKCYWNDTIDWDSNVITNFDWYHPLHAHFHTPDEVKRWFADNKVTIENFDVMESGISALGKKAG